MFRISNIFSLENSSLCYKSFHNQSIASTNGDKKGISDLDNDLYKRVEKNLYRCNHHSEWRKLFSDIPALKKHLLTHGERNVSHINSLVIVCLPNRELKEEVFR